MSDPDECANPECEDPPTTHHGGYCAPCYMWRRRHNNTDRPAHIIEAHYHRTINTLCTQNYTHVAHSPDLG